LTIAQQNNYPWNGDLKFVVSPEKNPLSFALKLRIPGWARNEAIPSPLYSFKTNSTAKVVILVNGAAVDYLMDNGYAVLNRVWKKNDVVEMKLPMEVRRVLANENLKDDIGKVALQRGPLMYCAEWPDNNGRATNIVLSPGVGFTEEYQASLLNGVVVLKSTANVHALVTTNDNVSTKNQSFMAIPYYAWANRGKGEMMV